MESSQSTIRSNIERNSMSNTKFCNVQMAGLDSKMECCVIVFCYCIDITFVLGNGKQFSTVFQIQWNLHNFYSISSNLTIVQGESPYKTMLRATVYLIIQRSLPSDNLLVRSPQFVSDYSPKNNIR